MSTSRLLPHLVKAVAVSKPRRERWLVEELLDVLIVGDENVRVEATRFPGVLAVLSEILTPYDISRLARRLEFSFMSRLVPAVIVKEVSDLRELMETIAEVLGKRGLAEVNLIATIRGDGKKVVTEGKLRDLMMEIGYRFSRSSPTTLAVESIDRIFIVTVGTLRKCGLGCKLLVVE